MAQLHVSAEKEMVCRDVFRRPLAAGSHSSGCKPAKTAAASSDGLQRFVIRYKTFLFWERDRLKVKGKNMPTAKNRRQTFHICVILFFPSAYFTHEKGTKL
ncbi:olfactory receptor [Neisseria subflava]|jgi:hypothetical protein|uniref:Uncharacterized protein n=1 Tax=Neisseria subflava TaxID=28449 RepID=A0A9X9I078_NEISU|nr:olfactory receptor [Neisseria subflava]UTG72775.1 hypothetical protein KCG56_05100 [Neisseria subflava]